MVLFCQFWSLIVPIHFHCKEKSSQYNSQNISFLVLLKKTWTRFWNDMNVNKWWQSYVFIFLVIYLFDIRTLKITHMSTHKCVPAPKLHTPKLTLRMGSPHRNINESVPFRGLKRGFGAESGITTQCVWVHRALLVHLWGVTCMLTIE